MIMLSSKEKTNRGRWGCKRRFGMFMLTAAGSQGNRLNKFRLHLNTTRRYRMFHIIPRSRVEFLVFHKLAAFSSCKMQILRLNLIVFGARRRL